MVERLICLFDIGAHACRHAQFVGSHHRRDRLQLRTELAQHLMGMLWCLGMEVELIAAKTVDLDVF